ncbi:MAG: alanine racemase [Spirochaetales bacterium]|nr:alanine racemase [Spirochaetales bacterium]
MAVIPPLTYAEIDLNALAHNMRQFRKLVGSRVLIAPAVKANAYGHGLVPVAGTLVQNGASRLCVARIEEGVALREGGISEPILVFGNIFPDYFETLCRYDLTASISTTELAEAFSMFCSSSGRSLKVHLKIDTGMGRLGMQADGRLSGILDEIESVSKLPGLELEGIYSHFASADHLDKSYARCQFDLFKAVLDGLEKRGIRIPIRHMANSAALIEMPEAHLDMVRPGIATYGLYPSAETDRSLIPLKPAMSLKSRIIYVKDVPAGGKISYGSTYTVKEATRIATVAIGYADGYSRQFSNRGFMLVNGTKAPVVGRVCMDLILLDVGHLADVNEGDEVVIFGQQKDESIEVDELAHILGTINYEIVSTLADRVVRRYRTS